MKPLFAFMMIMSLQALSQGQTDSLLRSFASFHSPGEQRAFGEVLAGGADERTLIDLLLLVRPEGGRTDLQAVMDGLDRFVAEHPRYATGAEMRVKHLERLFDDVQDEFLSRYSEAALFDDLYVNGDFNCLTASGLFALLFDRYRLPYQLHVLPEHVYLVTLVDGTPVSVETTNPMSGVFAFDERSKRNYTKQLLRSKLVSTAQVDTMGMDAAIASLAEADSIVDLAGLAGAQYFNSGFAEFQAGRLDTAIAQLAKGQLLFPFQRTHDLLCLALAARVERSSLDGFEEFDLLGRAWAYIDGDEKGDAICSTQALLLDRYLFQESDTTTANALQTALLRHVKRPDVKDRLVFQYHYEMGRFMAIKQQFDLALEDFLLAHELRPQHAQLSEWVVNVLVDRLRRTADRGGFATELDALVEAHPGLKDLPTMRRCYMITYLWAAEDHFNIDMRGSAEEYIQAFEAIWDPKMADLPVDGVAGAYIAGWRSWTRARREDKARACLARGREIAPFNPDLERFSRYQTY